jgi:amino acid permease
MDWSSVFEDEGEEDGNWVREEISSRTRIFGLFGKDGYTPLVCYAFTVNYILGVGCLGIPYAFLQSGMVLGSILVVALSMVSYLTVLWVAEATQQEITIAGYHLTKSTNPFIMSPFSSQVRRNHRVRNTGLPKHGAHSKSSVSDSQTTGNILMTSIKSVLSSATMESFGLLSSASTPTNPHGGVGGKVPNYSALSPVDGSMHQQHTMEEELHFASLPSSTRLTNHYHASHRNKSSASMAHSRMSSQENLNASTTNPQQQQLLQQQTLDRMTVQELEVTDLAEEFLGPMGKVLYQSALMALTYVGLLAYAQVFNDTFRLQLWPTVPAWIPPLLFGAIVVPLSCFDLQEQIAAQVTMSLLRFVSLGILVVGTLVALCVDYEHSALAMATSAGGALNSSPQPLPLVRWQGFGIMFTTAIFSQLFQHSVPGLIRPLSKDNKKFIPSIFRAALITTASLYVVTGCVCVAYFGERLSQSVNLDFVGFTWGLARDNGKETVALMLVQALAMIVVLFPALDTLSVFPLIAITLGNNLHAACPQVTHYLFGHLSATSSSEDSAPSSTTPPVGGTFATHVVVHKNSPRKRYATVFWRLVAAIPPVLCSLEVRHLVVSLQIAGLCGILVALVFPALLHQHAQERSAMLPLSWTTTPSYTLYLSFSWSLWPWPTSTPLGSSATSNGEGANAVEAVHPSQAGDSTVVVSGVLVVAAAALAISIYQML